MFFLLMVQTPQWKRASRPLKRNVPEKKSQSSIRLILIGLRMGWGASVFHGFVFQAVSEMSALTQIVQNEVEVSGVRRLCKAKRACHNYACKAQITRYANNLLHSVGVGVPFQKLRQAAGLLSASQPVVASGPQLTTNVRVAASEEPFYTVAELVEDMVMFFGFGLCSRNDVEIVISNMTGETTAIVALSWLCERGPCAWLCTGTPAKAQSERERLDWSCDCCKQKMK